jgi:16S rRNA (uracil1498-N3)-methyltransferase
MFRVYTPDHCALDTFLLLSNEASQHILKVLRHQIGDVITLFNGQGGEYTALITDIQKKNAVVKLTEFFDISREAPCFIHLFHGMARGEKMDWIIQKATELGVQEFTPLKTEKCQVKLTGERAEKRLEHWQRIIVHSSEQCGRNQLMKLHPIVECKTAMEQRGYYPIICEPRWPDTLPTTPINTPMALFIGGESGFSPRILRTETAAIVAVTRLQYLKNDAHTAVTRCFL